MKLHGQAQGLWFPPRRRARYRHNNRKLNFINPPELGIAEQQIKLIKNGRFILIPASLETYGHGTHTHAAVWQKYLKQLLDESQH